MPTALRNATVIDGKYRIERPLGKGGMGAVFLATHLGTTRTVALKVIVPHLSANQDFFLRFQREAEAAGRLRHPNVVNVTDFGVTEHDGGELAYLVMEYLDGQTLADFLRTQPRPPLEQVADIVEQIALALDAAHGLGIVHRDLKPENVWLESDRRGGYNVKVLDFGIAKVSDARAALIDETTAQAVAGRAASAAWAASPASDPGSDDTAILVIDDETRETAVLVNSAASGATTGTLAGSLVGTPAYMSPEQCQGGVVDGRSDVYSLAVITYQMLAGDPPFKGETLAATLHMQIAEPPPSLDLRRPALPHGLGDIVERALSKEPGKRPATAGTFAAQIRVGAEGEARLLREAKAVSTTLSRIFFPLLAFGLVPAAVLLSGGVIVRQVWRHLALSVPAVSIALSIGLSIFAFVCGAQVYEAVCALALRRFAATRHYALEAGTTARDTMGIAGAWLKTKLRSALALRPRHFVDHALWSVVCALEGLSGSAALRRSSELTAAVRPLARAALARQLGIATIASLIFPLTFAVLDPTAIREYARMVSTPGGIAWFYSLYPIIMLIAYISYGPARSGLYWTARQCLGEARPPEMPDLGRRRESRGNRLELPLLAWAGLPSAALLIVVFALVRLAVTGPTTVADLAAEGRWVAFEAQIARGGSVDTRDPGSLTALMYAARDGNLERVRLLLARGADVNARSERGATPLREAVMRGDTDVVTLLLERGADPNTADSRGRTPLMYAAMRGRAGVTALLLGLDAKRDARDEFGRTARDYAAAEGHDTIVALLDAPPRPLTGR